MKEQESRHIKINATLSLVYIVAIIIAVSVTNTTQAQGDGQSNEVTTSLKYELPKITNTGVSEKLVEHIPQIIGCPTTDDYKNSGYDRGHMAPAGDMKWSEQAITESFYLSNICPQNHNLNGGDWKALEEHLRTMATQYEKVYIACGPIISAKPKTIGMYHQVAVPDAFFKVVLRKKGDSWSAIGFMMPNQAGHKSLNKYAMSVDDIEIITDMDFFYNLHDEIEEIVESSYQLSDWSL